MKAEELRPGCRGKCKGDRGALESPAKIVTLGRKAFVVCPCCGNALIEVPTGEKERAPNLAHDVDARQKRMRDLVCDYDVVLLADITARA